jgi:hypothetical protein
MERTRLPEGKMKWKKTGGGSLRLSNMRFIRSGQVFDAYPHEIPLAFRDVVICLSPVDEINAEKEKKIDYVAVKANAYSLVSRGIGYWNVVDKNGKVINEKALRKDKAEELLKSLEV